MTSGPLLRSETLNRFRALGTQGSPVFSSAGQLRSAISRQMGIDVANILAIPQINEAGDRVDWYAPYSGAVIPWSAATPDERAQAKSAIENLRQSLNNHSATLLEQLKESKGGHNYAAETFARMLPLAGVAPDDSHVYLVDGKPVVTFWGFEPLDAPTNWDALSNLSISSAAPPPVAASATVPKKPALKWRWLLWPLLLFLLLGLLLTLAYCGLNSVPLPNAIDPYTPQENDGAILDDPNDDSSDPSSPSAPDIEQNVVIPRMTPVAPNGSVAVLDADHPANTPVDNMKKTDGMGGVNDALPVPSALDPNQPGEGGKTDQLQPDHQPLSDQLPPNHEPLSDQLPPDHEPLSDQLPQDHQPSSDQLPQDHQPSSDQLPQDHQPSSDQLPQDHQPSSDQPASPPDTRSPADKTSDQNKQDKQNKDRNGAPLVIPPGNAANNTNFLNGQWTTKSGLVDAKTGKPLDVQYSFKDGKGEIQVRRHDGTLCSAPVTTTMDKRTLVIDQQQEARCPDGKTYKPSRVQCRNTVGGKAACKGSYADGTGYSVNITQ